MKIVVLDGHTLNPGDLNWQPLEALGEVVLHDRTRPEEIIPRAQAAEIILTNKTPLGRPTCVRPLAGVDATHRPPRRISAQGEMDQLPRLGHSLSNLPETIAVNTGDS